MIKPKIVPFKSEPDFYNKEKIGIKRNTVRKVTDEQKFKTIKRFHDNEISTLKIMIQNKKDGDLFMRDITDVSYWKDIVILSW